MNIGVLALAAGRGRRFGSDKRLALMPDGQRVIDRFLNQLELSGLPLLLCLDERDQELAAVLKLRGVNHLLCHNACQGMGATLAEGIQQVGAWDGVLVALADMPWVAADSYRAVASRLRPDRICVPTYKQCRGHPVGFGKQFFSALAALGGDTGARQLLRQFADQVDQLELADPAIQRDIDRPADLGRTAGSVD